MIFLIIAGYGIYSGNMWCALIGGAGLGYAVWDRQNWLARKNGTWGETGWAKTPKGDD